MISDIFNKIYDIKNGLKSVKNLYYLIIINLIKIKYILFNQKIKLNINKKNERKREKRNERDRMLRKVFIKIVEYKITYYHNKIKYYFI